MIASVLLSLCHASPVSQGGFEAEAIGRSRGGAALIQGAGSILLNPGGLRAEESAELLLGFASIRYSFLETPSVWWDVNQDGVVDDWDEPLRWGEDYPRADGFLISASRPIGDRFAIGMDLFLPRDRLLRLQGK